MPKRQSKSGIKIIRPGESRYSKTLFFAPGGHGKTTLLGSAQEDERTYPMLFLDFEGGHEVLTGLDIDVIEIRKWPQFDEAYELLKSGDHDYRSVGVDSISEVHRFALMEFLRIEGPSRKNPDHPEQKDYLRAATQMRRFVRLFRDLPMHVFFAAHAKQVEEPRVGMVKVPDLSGTIAEEVPSMVSVCGYLALEENEEGEVDRVLLLTNYPKFRIKVRMPWGIIPPDDIVNPTITKLLDVLEVD